MIANKVNTNKDSVCLIVLKDLEKAHIQKTLCSTMQIDGGNKTLPLKKKLVQS